MKRIFKVKRASVNPHLKDTAGSFVSLVGFFFWLIPGGLVICGFHLTAFLYLSKLIWFRLQAGKESG